MKTRLLSLLLISFATLSTIQAQTVSSSAVDKLKQDPAAYTFVQKATMANTKEIETGRLAQFRSQDKSVIEFAKKMVKDHSAASDQLTKILKAKNMNVPQESLPVDKSTTDLPNSTGAEFDKKYIQLMLLDHRKTIDLFVTAAKDVKDPDLKSYAAKMLPALKLHHEQASSIARKLNISTSH